MVTLSTLYMGGIAAKIYERMNSNAIEHNAMETRSVRNRRESGAVWVSTCFSPFTLRDRTPNNAAAQRGSATNRPVASSLGHALITKNTISENSADSASRYRALWGGSVPNRATQRKNTTVVPTPERTHPNLKMSERWSSGSTVERTRQIIAVPSDAMMAPPIVTRFFASASGKRFESKAMARSVATHAARCVSISVMDTLLLSVSCSQNDPENAMVFHAFQHPKPR